MWRITGNRACLIFLLLAGGCVPEPPPVQTSDQTEPDVLTLRRKNARLRKEKEHLRRENLVLKDKVASLSDREQQLSKKLADQQFEMEQLRGQLELLADLPAERDLYKHQAEKLRSEVIRLEMELRRFRRAFPSSAPAETRPAPKNETP